MTTASWRDGRRRWPIGLLASVFCPLLLIGNVAADSSGLARQLDLGATVQRAPQLDLTGATERRAAEAAEGPAIAFDPGVWGDASCLGDVTAHGQCVDPRSLKPGKKHSNPDQSLIRRRLSTEADEPECRPTERAYTTATEHANDRASAWLRVCP